MTPSAELQAGGIQLERLAGPLTGIYDPNLPSLGVAAVAEDVAVGELVDDRDLWSAREDRGQVHLLEMATAVGAGGTGDDLQAVEHRLGARAPVVLREPHHHVRPAGGTAPPLVEHAVGLADSVAAPR